MKTPIYVVLLSICLVTKIVCAAADVISRSPSPSLSAGGNSFRPIISADGSRVVFVSHANNLVTNDNRREWLDVFARDLVTSNTVLVSVTSTGSGGGNGNSTGASISSHGQFVAFASEAGDLVNGDMNGASNVFVRDLVTGTTRLISRSFQGYVLVDGSPSSIIPLSGNPLITSDGRFVFFESRAPEISYGIDMNNAVDVFRYDLLLNETILVSSRIPFEGVSEPANATSLLSSITPDGQRVAFVSGATNLASGVSNSLGDVYVRDMASNVTYWASASLDYPDGYRCVSVALSENGRYVAFTVVPLNGPPAVYRRNLASNALLLIETNVLERATPQISADGRYVAFETGTNIFRWDATSGQAELVNVAMTGLPPTNGVARNATMTADGNSVVFVSDSGDLTTNNSAGVFQIYARNMGNGATHLISVAADGRPGGPGSEFSLFALAHDVPRVAFDSAASDLVEGDGNRASDVFVRDLSSATTHLVSARTPSLPRTTGIGHALLGTDSVSADGRFIAFSSYDNDLVPGDTNGWSDIFIHDMLTGVTVTPGFSATNLAKDPVISSDGRFVAYSRFTFFLSSSISPQRVGIFRFDRVTGTNELVTAASSGGLGTKCAMSPDGNFIAFRTSGILSVRNMTHGTNLNLGSAESMFVSSETGVDAVFSPDGRFLLFKSTQLYAYDFSSNRTHLVSGSIPFNSGPVGYSHGLTISGNSRFAVFRSSSAGLIIHDLLSETNGFVADGRYPSINADGRYVAFQLDQQSDPWFRQVVVQDRQSGTLELVTRNPAGAPATPILFHPTVISGDARYVLFGEWATNLVSNDTNRLGDVFVRDRLLGTTTLISRNAEGTVGNAASSYRLAMAADGRTVFFQSLASDLVAGDYNDKRDIFVLKLGGADTDGDGMDDDWEMAYFETKARDGNGDHDGDGSSDRNEFLAGTDPTNAGSVFRVLTVAPAGGGNKTLFWSGNPDRSYRAEFKDDLGAAGWTALTGTVLWNGSSASIADPSAGGATNRYYRVVRLP